MLLFMKELSIDEELVYVALGGNIGDVSATLKKALTHLKSFAQIIDLKTSRFYETTPVSPLPQNPYINAVCSFKTLFSAHELLGVLQQIEIALGKEKKPKSHPRKIDLDILFFGKESLKDDLLEIPHPRWQERLFVLVPLFDLTTEIEFFEDGKKVKIEIGFLIKEFININNEKVVLYE